jgi:cytochrome c-type biogenesis protein
VSKLDVISDWSIWWYNFLTNLGVKIATPIVNLTDQWNIPLVTALLLGIVAATSPCQLSTNSSAVALLSRNADRKKDAYRHLIAFIIGKVIVYGIIGGIAIYLGVELVTVNENTSAMIVIRQIYGPIMILAGLYFLGIFRSKISFGVALSQRLKRKIPEKSPLSSFLFGSSFALAFCPTLVWLFFGLLVPLGVQTTGGILLPILFAIGTAIPLIFFVSLLTDSTDILKQKSTKNFNRTLNKIAAIIFILAGLNDIFTYWFI